MVSADDFLSSDEGSIPSRTSILRCGIMVITSDFGSENRGSTPFTLTYGVIVVSGQHIRLWF